MGSGASYFIRRLRKNLENRKGPKCGGTNRGTVRGGRHVPKPVEEVGFTWIKPGGRKKADVNKGRPGGKNFCLFSGGRREKWVNASVVTDMRGGGDTRRPAS